MGKKTILTIGLLVLCFASCRERNQEGQDSGIEEGAIRETKTEGMEQAKEWELKGVQESPDSIKIDQENSGNSKVTDTIEKQ